MGADFCRFRPPGCARLGGRTPVALPGRVPGPRDLRHGPAAERGAVVLPRAERLHARARLEQQPLILARAGPARADQRPFALQLLAPHFEVEQPLAPRAERGSRRASGRSRCPRPSPCHRHTAPPEWCLQNWRNRGDDPPPPPRDVFPPSRKGWFFGIAHDFSHAAHRQPEIVMEMRGVVLLDDEHPLRAALADLPRRFLRLPEIALLFVSGQPAGSRNLPARRFFGRPGPDGNPRPTIPPPFPAWPWSVFASRSAPRRKGRPAFPPASGPAWDRKRHGWDHPSYDNSPPRPRSAARPRMDATSPRSE